MSKSEDVGEDMYCWAQDLFPINRSLTGKGNRATLYYIKQIIPNLNILEVPSGTKAFDWEVPNEWNVKEAWIKDENGRKICDFSDCNLHLMGYSIPVDTTMSLLELQEHLYSLPEQPTAIPYVTSYYKKRWGFCIAHNQRKELKEGKYHVFIDSSLEAGSLTYGEVILPGKSKQEILLSTYICHPSMANNELSGPVVTTAITRWLNSLGSREFTYRVIFIPETIGSILYLSKHHKHLKKSVVAGFVLTCIGDNNSYSMLESRYGDTLADKVAQQVLKHHCEKFIKYSFLERGSDERQYCAPGIDLPVCDLMRSKYGKYQEYHTSLDNLDFISKEGLRGGFEITQKCIKVLESNRHPNVNILCEPQLGKRGLYPTLSTKNPSTHVGRMMNFIAYCDGKNDLVDIAEKLNVSALDLIELMQLLEKEKVITV